MSGVVFAVGLLVVLATWSSVMRTLVVPRGLSSWLTAAVSKSVRVTFAFVSGRFGSYERRDRILVTQGPTTLVAFLAVWVLLFLAWFQLTFAGATGVSISNALRASGSSVFTLGTYAPGGGLATATAFFAAATGLVVVALQIAYL